MFDTLRTVRAGLEGVARDFEPETLSGEQAARAVRELGVIRRLTDGLLAKAAKRVDDTMAHAKSGACDAAQFLANELGVGSGEARRAIDNAKKLRDLPATDDAVRAGKLSARQAQMIADAATHNPAAEQELLDAAAEGLVHLRDACTNARAAVEDPAARAKRQHAARRLRMWSGDDGMVEGQFSLTPEVGGQIKALIDDQTQRNFRNARTTGVREPHEAYAADALANLLLGDTQAGRRGVRVNVHVVIDHPALVRGNPIDGERCEIPGVGPVNVEWVREVLGSAFVTAVIRKGVDIATVAHLGRHVPAELLTAMIVGGRECDIEGCHHRGYLERDHSEIDYAKGGPTAWWNLAWLCYIHHKRKTKGAQLGPRSPDTGKRKLCPPDAVSDAA